MTNTQAELTHLVRLSRIHPNCAEYCMAKANWLAQRRPAEFSDLPMLLSNALENCRITPNGPSRLKPSSQPATTASR